MNDEPHIVVLPGSIPKVWGPFTSKRMANEFAAFVRAEIDPPLVLPLSSPVDELLSWRAAVALPEMARNQVSPL
jgi:hypothetical protein